MKGSVVLELRLEEPTNTTTMLLSFDQPDIETLHEKSDEEVLALSVKHPHLFSEILKRYQDAFVRKAESVLRNREEAEDVTQETFMKIYQYADRFHVVEGASFKSWGYKILMNTTFTKYQKLKKERDAMAPLEMEFFEMLPDKESEQFEREEMRDYVVSVLTRMPDNMARVLKLYFLEKRPQQEIAEMEGTSVGAIKTRMHRAKIEFRNTLKSITLS